MAPLKLTRHLKNICLVFISVNDSVQLRLDAAIKISLEKAFSKCDAVSGCLIIIGKFTNMVKTSAWIDSCIMDRLI